MKMPFDLVADVTFLRGRFIASSKAYFRMRSTPTRLITEAAWASAPELPAATSARATANDSEYASSDS